MLRRALRAFAVAVMAVAVSVAANQVLNGREFNVRWLAAAIVLGVGAEALNHWLEHRAAAGATAVTSERLGQAKDVLAGLVEQQWRAEAILRSLDDPDPIPVRWRLTERAGVMDRPANLDRPVRLDAASDQIAVLAGDFRRMRRRRLVLLGGPGTGKTTLAVQLVRELLATREPAEPVPVLLSVAGWDTDGHPRLQEWVAARIAQDYPALRAPDVLGALTGRGHVLPVLDGLDELPGPAQAAVLAALNRSLGDVDQIILTSRTTEFEYATEAAGDVLTSAIVIEPLPLSPGTAADYLERCLPPNPGPDWGPVLDGLRASPLAGSATAMAEVAANPLGLWLLRTVYLTPRAHPAELLDAERFPDAAALRNHLFDQLVPAVINARPPTGNRADLFRPRRRHDPAQVQSRLGYLADYLSRLPTEDGGQGTRDLLWWRLAGTTLTARMSAPARILYGLLFGLVGGLSGYLLFGGWRGALIVGFPATVLAEGSVWSWLTHGPGYADLRLTGGVSPAGLRDWLRRVLGFEPSPRSEPVIAWVGAVYGVLLGGTSGLSAHGLIGGVLGGLVFGVLGAGIGGFLGGLSVLTRSPGSSSSSPPQAAGASTPLTSWRIDRNLSLVHAGIGLVSLLLIAAMTWASPKDLVGAALLGVLVGFLFGDQAWLAYLIVTYRLARARVLPYRLMSFLDDAHRLGLLRTVGPIYQFRHADLQDHFAAGYTGRRHRLVATVRRRPWFRRLLRLILVIGVPAGIVFLPGLLPGSYPSATHEPVPPASTSHLPVVHLLGKPITTGGFVNTVVFNPDDGTLVTGSYQGGIRLWKVKNQAESGPAIRTAADFNPLALSRDGRSLAVGGGHNGRVQLFDTRTRRLTGELQGHTNSVESLAFSPDGTMLVTGGDDGTARLWSTRQRRQLGAPLTGYGGFIDKVAFSPDSRTVATSDQDNTTRFWDVATHHQLGGPLLNSGSAVVFSPNGRMVATASGGVARLWDAATHQEIGAPFIIGTAQKGSVQSIAFSPDSRTLAIGGRDANENLAIQIWDISAHRQLTAPITVKAGDSLEEVDSVAFSPDGRLLATGSDDNIARIWKLP